MAFANLLYPALCFHCETSLKTRGSFFCPACLNLLTLINPKERCSTCFLELDGNRCERCCKRTVVIQRQLAACDLLGPASTLLRELKKGNVGCVHPAAALMAYQFTQHNSKLPDLIVPLPNPFWAQMNTSLQLSKELSHLLQVPVSPLLSSHFNWPHFFSTAELNYRYLCPAKHHPQIADKCLLIVSTTLQDQHLRKAGYALQEGFPSEIKAISLAM